MRLFLLFFLLPFAGATFYHFAPEQECITSSTFSGAMSGVGACYDRAISDNKVFFSTSGSWCKTTATCNTVNTGSTHYEIYTTLNCAYNEYIDTATGTCQETIWKALFL